MTSERRAAKAREKEKIKQQKAAEKAQKKADRAAEKARKKAERAQKKADRKAEKRKKKFKRQYRLLFPADKNGFHKIGVLGFLRFFLYPLQRLLFPQKYYTVTGGTLHKKKRGKPVGAGAYIYVLNHYCLWDVFFAARTTRDGMHFLAKAEVFDVPVMGYFARRLGVIGAARDGSDARTLMDSMKVLKNGEKLVIFPEGTRNKKSDETFLPFRGGAALMAIKTQTPVIPMVLCRRPRLFRKTPVVIGEPFELSSYYGRKLSAEEYAEADKLLEDKLYALRGLYREMRAARKNRNKNKKTPEGADGDISIKADIQTPAEPQKNTDGQPPKA